MSLRLKPLAAGLLAVAVAACSPGAATQPNTNADVAATAGSSEAIVTSSGFTCPAASPKVEVTSKELNLFVWTEYIPQDMIECFERIYGVTVNREEYSSNEELGAKLDAGGTNYDLVQPTDYYVSVLIRKGQLQKLDKSRLTILNNMDPKYMDLAFDKGNAYTLPYQGGTDAIVVNTAKVSNSPASWADLWKPEYVDAARMVFLDDSRVTIGLTLLTLGYDVNTTDPAQLEEAKARLLELVPGIKLWDSDSPKTALIAGDVDLGMTWTGEAVLAQREVPDIQFVYPSEGAILWQDNYAIPAAASHLDAAYAWLNYTYQGDVFWLMLRDFPYNNPDKAALDYAAGATFDVTDPDGNQTTPKALYDAYMASTITNVPADVFAKGHRVEDVGDATALYDRIWTEIKGGN